MKFTECVSTHDCNFPCREERGRVESRGTDRERTITREERDDRIPTRTRETRFRDERYSENQQNLAVEIPRENRGRSRRQNERESSRYPEQSATSHSREVERTLGDANEDMTNEEPRGPSRSRSSLRPRPPPAAATASSSPQWRRRAGSPREGSPAVPRRRHPRRWRRWASGRSSPRGTSR